MLTTHESQAQRRADVMIEWQVIDAGDGRTKPLITSLKLQVDRLTSILAKAISVF